MGPCPEHASLNPDYGSCAPLHFDRNAEAEDLRRFAGEAERRARALLAYADKHRRAAELSDHAWKLDPESEEHAATRAGVRAHADSGRAELHLYNDLAAIRDRIIH